ncbi:MAG: MFS transporter [Caldilinea sp. CFX5]|nr:MFS transporter [Caldilinea sp. CFX5]
MLHTKANGFRIFSIIWFGQLVSLFGTAMTRFALLIWAYQQTGAATTLALLGFFAWLPFIVVSPLAGVLVDRFDRRKIMILADLGAGVSTIGVLLLLVSGQLEIWHLFVLEAAASFCEAFQTPAYTALSSTLLDKASYARASGMRSLAGESSQIIAPVGAGLLLGLIGLEGILIIDITTFVIAMVTMAIVRLPATKLTLTHEADTPFGQQLTFGFRYIFQRPGLVGLLVVFMGINLCAALTYYSILPAMILARTGGNEVALSIVQAMLGVGGVLGGIVVSVRGLPRRKIHAIFGFAAVSFVLGDLLLAVGRSVPGWATAAVLGAFFIPFIVAGDRFIWQTKVAPALQGRIFSVQAMLRNCSFPVGYLLSGPLADRLFEPAMQPGGAWAATFGWLVGTGPGAGMALMFVGTAVLGMTISLCGYLIPAVRNVEQDLPDHESEAVVHEMAPAPAV